MREPPFDIYCGEINCGGERERERNSCQAKTRQLAQLFHTFVFLTLQGVSQQLGFLPNGGFLGLCLIRVLRNAKINGI